MKKVLAVAAVVCVMCVAGTALARQNDRNDHRHQPPMNQPRFMQEAPGFPGIGPRGDFMPGHEGRHCGFGGFEGRGHRCPTFTPDMPKEIREKAAELAKLRVDLEEAMTSHPLNKEKALDVHAKIQKVRQEIGAWRFAQKLERIEGMQKQLELNRKVPPAKPEAVPETPEPETAR